MHSWRKKTFSCKWNMASGPWKCIAALQTNTEFHLLQLCAKFGGKIVLHWLLGWQREYKSGRVGRQRQNYSLWYFRNNVLKIQKSVSDISGMKYWKIRNDFWYFSNALHPKAPPTTPLVILWYIDTAVPKRKLVISKKGNSNIFSIPLLAAEPRGSLLTSFAIKNEKP